MTITPRRGAAARAPTSYVIKLSRCELKLDFPKFRMFSVILTESTRETPKLPARQELRRKSSLRATENHLNAKEGSEGHGEGAGEGIGHTENSQRHGRRPSSPVITLSINGLHCLIEIQKLAEWIKSGLPYAVYEILVFDPKTLNDSEGRKATFYAKSNQRRAGALD